MNPDAPAHGDPRWFGPDDFDGPPRLAGGVMRQPPLVAPPRTGSNRPARAICQGASPSRAALGGRETGRCPCASTGARARGLRLAGLTLVLVAPRIRTGDALCATFATFATLRGEGAL